MEKNEGVMAEMPKYQCHKKVWALKIKGISLPLNEAGDAELGFYEPFQSILMPREWLDKHSPEVGGYYVVYEDGYKSFSPAEAFEQGYTEID